MSDYPPPEIRTRTLAEYDDGWLLDGMPITDTQALRVFNQAATPLIIRPLSANSLLRPRLGGIVLDELAETGAA